MKYKVYILLSEKFNRYYIGSTGDLEKRIKFHNSVRARWTKRCQPCVLMHFEEYDSRSEAMIRERYLKFLKNIRKFLESNNLLR